MLQGDAFISPLCETSITLERMRPSAGCRQVQLLQKNPSGFSDRPQKGKHISEAWRVAGCSLGETAMINVWMTLKQSGLQTQIGTLLCSHKVPEEEMPMRPHLFCHHAALRLSKITLEPSFCCNYQDSQLLFF